MQDRIAAMMIIRSLREIADELRAMHQERMGHAFEMLSERQRRG